MGVRVPYRFLTVDGSCLVQDTSWDETVVGLDGLTIWFYLLLVLFYLLGYYTCGETTDARAIYLADKLKHTT